MTRSSRPCRQLPTDLSNGTCRSGAMSFCTFLLSTESSASQCREGKKSRRMAGPPSPPARAGLTGVTPPWKAPPGLVPFLLTSCQVRVASRHFASRRGRMADGRAMLLHRETPESFWLVCETQFESAACETDNSLKDLGQRWKLKGPHIFD
ncbi:hypothetical protein G5I_00728 [Acromyrmex echinatior]|uniref:Uncharacterized protein n=1 Tax=Acromyrmex echinatior TaxID=103372 RepID=F4W5N0_ACREC|nr:hypothetical protein G5I_00728 [Acromyrmex echinatior]